MNYNASHHQKRIWFIDEFERGNLYEEGPTYHNIPLILGIRGSVEFDCLTKTVQHLVNINEVLRTRIVEKNNLIYQEILDEKEVNIEVIDWSDMRNSLDEGVKYLVNKTKEAFSEGIYKDLFKVIYLKLGKEESILLFILHHAICDDKSKDILRNQFVDTYEVINNGEKPRIEASEIQYVDFALWQLELDEELIESQIMYWKKKINTSIQALEINTDYPRKAIHIYESEVFQMEVPCEVVDKLDEIKENFNIDKREFFLGVFKIILKKYSGLDEINIGTSIKDNRLNENKDTVGPISNLVLLSDIIMDEDNILDVIKKVKDTYEEAKEYSIIPFDLLVMELNPDNDMSRTAFFDVLFNYIVDNDDTYSKFYDIDLNLGWGKYDYNLLVKEKSNSINLIMTYNKLYFNEKSVERLMLNYLNLCKSFLNNPIQSIDEVEYISLREKELIFKRYQYDKKELSNYCIHEIFEKQAKLYASNVAVKDSNRSITYEELNNKSSKVANYLQKKGVKNNDIITLLTDKNIDCIIAILGILKVGASYLPIDPDLPEKRIKYMIKNSKSKVLIYQKERNFEIDYKYIGLSIITVMEESKNLSAKYVGQVKPDDVAYIIYTSGTTGNPKGAMIEHQNVVKLIVDNEDLFKFKYTDVWTMFHSYNFDFSVWEMYGALLTGGKLIVIDRNLSRDTKMFRRCLIENEVSILNQTPSAFYALSYEELSYEEKALKIRKVIFGGEVLNTAKLCDWIKRYEDVEMINMYGITETTIHVTYKKLKKTEIIEGINTIGKVLPSYSGYVMDSKQQIVPIGVKGELVVGGSGVAKGYLNMPDLTKKKFIQNPYIKNERLYRSGDLVRYKYNGELEYLGRIDQQVKIRGFRIEIGEIEQAILKYEMIRDTVVLAKENEFSETELVGYIVLKNDNRPIFNELKGFLKDLIPEYMIPVKFFKVEKIPLTTNGKIDRNVLSANKDNILNSGDEFVEPTTIIQKELVELWKGIIGNKHIGIYDNFFYLGGNSLLVSKLVFLINEKYHVSIPYQYFFTKSTIKDLEDYIINHQNNNNIIQQEEIDLEKEKQLDKEIEKGDLVLSNVKKNILLTGATGFLGAYLLKDLLKNTDANIYCLVRGESKEVAINRITKNMEFYQLQIKPYLNRVIPVVGDLEKPLLGVRDEEYEKLSKIIDVIYHNAAIAMYGYGYLDLKKANVYGTEEILRLASTNILKPVNYVSTISVYDGTVKEYLKEDDTPDYSNTSNLGGYSRSKIVAEGLINIARERGLIVNIYRPGRICGDSKTGACQDKDFLWLLIKTYIEVKSMINGNISSDMVSVDKVSEAIVKMSMDDRMQNCNCNLHFEQSFSLSDICDWLNECDYEIIQEDYNEWYDKIFQYAKKNPDSTCALILPLMNSNPLTETSFNCQFDNVNARTIYNIKEKFVVKDIKDLFKNTINFFKEKGVLPEPSDVKETIYDKEVLPTDFMNEFQ